MQDSSPSPPQFSLKTLVIVLSFLGTLPVWGWWLANETTWFLLPFAFLLVLSLYIGIKDFGSDIHADPPNHR